MNLLLPELLPSDMFMQEVIEADFLFLEQSCKTVWLLILLRKSLTAAFTQ